MLGLNLIGKQFFVYCNGDISLPNIHFALILSALLSHSTSGCINHHQYFFTCIDITIQMLQSMIFH